MTQTQPIKFKVRLPAAEIQVAEHAAQRQGVSVTQQLRRALLTEQMFTDLRGKGTLVLARGSARVPWSEFRPCPDFGDAVLATFSFPADILHQTQAHARMRGMTLDELLGQALADSQACDQIHAGGKKLLVVDPDGNTLHELTPQ